MAVYIRHVGRDPRRTQAIEALAKKVVAAGSTLILAENTLPMAEHAAAQGWIAPAALAGIAAEKEADAAADRVGDPVGAGREGGRSDGGGGRRCPRRDPAAVDSGAVEEALETGDEDTQKPPTIVVKGDNSP